MNGSRGPLIALALALLLGVGYWGWAVKLQPRRAQEAEDAKLLFRGLDPAGTTEVLLRKSGSADVLLRKVEGQWRLVTPVAAPADTAAVGALLSQLAAAKRADIVADKGADLRDFGLDKPSGEVTFRPATPGAKAQVLFFGLTDPEGDQAYGMVQGLPQVFLTDVYTKNSILKSAAELRDKTVWSFQPGDVESARSSIGGFTLARDKQGYWRVRRGSRDEPAKAGQVDQWLGTLSQLRADSVPSETGKGSYGLARGGTLTLTLKSGAALTLREGGKAKPGPGFYVQVAGQGPVFQLPEYVRLQVEKKAAELLDLDAFGFDTGSVARFTVGRRGQPALTALKTAGSWAWVPAPPAASKPFDFNGFLAGLSKTQLLTRLDAKAYPKSPAATVTLYGDGDAVLEKADFGPRRGIGQVAASTSKHQVVVVPLGLLDSLPAAASSASPAPPLPAPGPTTAPVAVPAASAARP